MGVEQSFSNYSNFVFVNSSQILKFLKNKIHALRGIKIRNLN
jgi:hypothetical protein